MIYAYDTHSCLCYFNFIAIPTFVCPKWAYIELLISLHNDRHLFADGFVTKRPIAMKFKWDKENVSCLKLRKCHLNPTIFNSKLTMMFKLDLKKITLTAFRTPVQNGLMQKVNIFCTENEHLHALYAPTKIRTNWMRASCGFFVSEKNWPLLLAKGVYEIFFAFLQWWISELICGNLLYKYTHTVRMVGLFTTNIPAAVSPMGGPVKRFWNVVNWKVIRSMV